MPTRRQSTASPVESPAEAPQAEATPIPPKGKNVTGTISADMDLMFPTSTRGRSNQDADDRAQELLNDPSIFKVVYLTDDNGQPWDETTPSGKKGVDSFRNALANSVRKLSDGKFKLELRTIPASRQAAFAEAAGLENASHAYRIVAKEAAAQA